MGLSKYFGRSRSPPRAAPSTLARSQQTVSTNILPERSRSSNNTPPRPQNAQRRVVSDTSSRSLNTGLSPLSQQTPHTNGSLPLMNPTTDSLTRTAHINVPTSQPFMSNDSIARLYQMSNTLPNATHISVTLPGPSRNTSAHQKRTSQPHIVTPQELRKLRELIQERYQLDIRLWGARKAKPHVRDRVKDFMKQSDAKLAEVQRLVMKWNDRACFETDQQYNKFKTITQKILEPGKRKWMEEPPWLDAHVD